MLHESAKWLNVIMQKYVDRCLHNLVVCAKKHSHCTCRLPRSIDFYSEGDSSVIVNWIRGQNLLIYIYS
jgi:hypothetical protein